MRVRRPWVVLVTGVLTFGIACPIWYLSVTRELRDFGRRRDDMPFPFIVARPWMSMVGAALGMLLFSLAILGNISQPPSVTWAQLSTVVLGLLGAAAPLLIATWSLVRRISTAGMLVGRDPDQLPAPMVALMLSLVTPLVCANLQRSLNATWQPWRDQPQPPAPPPSPLALLAVDAVVDGMLVPATVPPPIDGRPTMGGGA